MIVRVFNVDKPDISFKFYLDPESMREGGFLIFTEENWSVTPRD